MKLYIFKKLSKNSTDLFVRGNDIISAMPLINSVHDLELTKLIKVYANEGFNNFFIDIGANIGLISCQVGAHFDKVFCYEPNPLCFNILKTNTRIKLSSKDVFLKNIGLGSKSNNQKLYIPKHNWGGAFIYNDDNLYDDLTLAKKDRFEEFNENNYLINNVEINSALDEFTNIFRILNSSENTNGVIKIDVEGLELTILDNLSKSIPNKIKTVIVFENHSGEVTMSKLNSLFIKRSIRIYKLIKSKPFNRGDNIILKFVKSIFKNEFSYIREARTDEDLIGEIIIKFL